MRRWIKNLLITLGVLLLLVLLPLIWLLGTESGLRWLVARVPAWVPGVSVETAQGSLLRRVRLGNLAYRQDQTTVEVRHFEFAWLPSALFGLEARIQKVHVEGIRVNLPPSPPEQEKPETRPEIPDIKLPLDIVLEDLRITDLEIHQAEKTLFQLDSASLQASAGDSLDIQHLDVDSPLFRLRVGQSTAGLSKPHPLRLKLHWSAPLPDLPEGSGEMEISGDLNELYVRHVLEAPAALRLTGSLRQPLEQLTWQARLEWDSLTWPPPGVEQPNLLTLGTGYITADGDLESYRVNLQAPVDGPRIPSGTWRASLAGDFSGLELESLQGETLEGQLTAGGRLNWQPQLSAQLELNTRGIKLTEFWADWPQAMTLDGLIRARFLEDTLSLEQLELSLPEAGSRIRGEGEVVLPADQESGPRIQADLNWETLHWPLLLDPTEGEPRDTDYVAQSRTGRAKIAGGLEDYQLELDLELAGAQIPPGQWQLRGRGSDRHLKLAGLNGEVLQGQLALTGEASWQPRVEWNLSLSGEGINPGAHWAEWPGRLALALNSRGHLAEDGPRVEAEIKQVTGKLREYPLSLQGRLKVAGEHYQVENLILNSGETRLQAQLSLDDKLNGAWSLDAPDLSHLLPAAGGGLRGSGRLGGSLKAPALALELDGNALRFEDWQMDNLDAKAEVELGGGETLEAKITAEQITRGQQVLLKSVKLQADGRLSAHELQAELHTPRESLELALAGAYAQAEQTWRGELRALGLASPDFGKWRLDAPATLEASAKAARLGRACLYRRDQQTDNGTAHVCLQPTWNADQGSHLQAELGQLPLSLAHPFLPEGTTLGGELGGNIQASLGGGGELGADIQLELSPGRVQTLVDHEPQRFAHRGGALKLAIDRQGLNADLGLKLLSQSGLDASLLMPGFNRLPLASDQPLEGRVNAQFADLNLLTTFVPQVREPSGEVKLNLELAGTPETPRFNGQFTVREAAVDLPDLGLELREMDLTLQAQGQDHLQLDAGLQSGEGRLKLSGNFKFPQLPQWEADLKVSGEKFTVINTPDIHALATPEVSLEARPGWLKLRGEVHIPEALLTPNIVTGHSQAGAVAESGDVVIVNQDKSGEEAGKTGDGGQAAPEAEEAPKWQMDIVLRVSLGDHINLEVVDFSSRLGGSLGLTMKPGQPLPLGNGVVEILDGTYRAYGQDLEIERGQIVFADSPVDNPGLNIKAMRRIYRDTSDNDIDAAGVHIMGTAQSPRLRLFSEPTQLRDSEVLSYILTGKAMTGSDLDKQTLSWGTYLRKDLYVSLGVSLYNTENKVFNLRYELNDNWGVESVIGDEDSGVDFSYTLTK